MPRWLPSQWHPLCLPLPCAGRWKQSLILCDRNEPLHWYPLISCTPPQWGQLRYQSIRTTPCNMTRLGLTHFTPYLPKKAAEWVLLKWDGEARRRCSYKLVCLFSGARVVQRKQNRMREQSGRCKVTPLSVSGWNAYVEEYCAAYYCATRETLSCSSILSY